MTPQWREFEKLVSRVEKALSPLGAIVKSPDHIPDKLTGEKREVDVSIRCKVGSVPILITVECRDRKGIEDVRWIEQIATKRNDIGAAKTIAVSSSGFSEPAIEKARLKGIEIRQIDKITTDEITKWLKVKAIVNEIYRSVLVGQCKLSLFPSQEDYEAERPVLDPSVQNLLQTDPVNARAFIQGNRVLIFQL